MIGFAVVLTVTFGQCSEGVGIVRYIIHFMYVLSGSPLTYNLILLLYLLSDLLLCAEALFMDLCGLLWGKPELCSG
jgi:ABC-type arginine/histidine transport system permease subunit